MAEKMRGTADVTVVAVVENYQAVDYLKRRFGARARQLGTLVVTGTECEEIPDPSTPDLDPPCVRVRLRYRHTCKNDGNHEWDARRFFERALADEEHWGDVVDVELHSWRPAD